MCRVCDASYVVVIWYCYSHVVGGNASDDATLNNAVLNIIFFFLNSDLCEKLVKFI